MALGGARKGAGRKKGVKAIQAEKSREFLVKKIAEELEPIIQAQIDAAKGMWVEKMYNIGKKKKVKIRIYQREPDTKAGEYLINQGAGKPKEAIEITGEGGKPIETTVYYLPKK